MAIPRRFELLTHSLEGCCSIQLSYGTLCYGYFGRDYWIRTNGILLPKQALYQAELSPESDNKHIISQIILFCKHFFRLKSLLPENKTLTKLLISFYFLLTVFLNVITLRLELIITSLSKEKTMLAHFNFHQFISAFLVLFAVIDIPGSIPVILSLKKRGKKVSAPKASLMSFIVFLIFFYVGEAFLMLFNVDISSFAVAGSIIIFVIAMEMILDISIFKDPEDAPKDATFVPVVFPLIAGAGALTTMLSIRAQFADINILLAILANMSVVYFALKATQKIQSFLGQAMIMVLQKFFGIILLAMSLKLFTTNITLLLNNLPVSPLAGD